MVKRSTFIFILIIGLFEVPPLLTGSGSLFRLWKLRRHWDVQNQKVVQLQQRNNALFAEINDLKNGDEAIEERARSELGFIKEGELFFQTTADSLPPR